MLKFSRLLFSETRPSGLCTINKKMLVSDKFVRNMSEMYAITHVINYM